MFFDLRMVGGVEWSDNIGNSPNNVEDIILLAGFDFGSRTEISPKATLDATIGMRYLHYVENPELSSLRRDNFIVINPDTEFDFSLNVGEFEIEVQDHLAFDIDPTDALVVDPVSGTADFNVLNYARLNNAFTARIIRPVTRSTTGFVEFFRNDEIPFQARFDFMRRYTQGFTGGVRQVFNSKLNGGLNASWHRTAFKESFHNDSETFSLGADLSWQVTDVIQARGDISFVNTEYEAAGAVDDRSDFEGILYGLSVFHEAREDFNHQLGFRVWNDIGFSSNFRQNKELYYTFNFGYFEEVSITGRYAHAWSEASGGFLGGDRYEQDLYELILARPILMERMTAELSLRHTNRDASIASRSFTRNQVVFRVSYDF